MMSAQGLTVSKSLEECLNMLPAYSRTLFEAAKTGYDQLGRGALVTMFPNIEALEREKMNAWQYLPRDILAEMDYSQVLQFVSMYNHETHFVALAIVNIKKPRAGKDNAIMLYMIGRDMQLVTQPNYGADGRVLHCRSVIAGDQIDVECRHMMMCAAYGCIATENLKICGGCRDARYCSQVCQLSHRAEHKEACKILKAAKDQAEAFVVRTHTSNSSRRP
jgi:MYND finger